MAAIDVIASELLKSAREADLNYKKTRDLAERDRAIRLRKIVENLRLLTFGASDLNGLSDVTISAPANAQVLTYNSTTGQWENQTPGGGGGGGDMYKSTYDVDNDGIVDGSETTQIIVRNSTGSTLTKGQVVYLSGATGNRPNAVLSQANTETTSSKTIGIVVANINNNSDGFVAVNGTLHNLDTSAFADGVAVWLSATTAGAYTSTIPAEPNHTVFIGYVARSHPTQGRLVILIQNGYELNELHGVLISSEANNDLLVYESSSTLWKNKSISTIFGGTPLVSVPTLAQVTTAGNTTTNAITVGGLNLGTNIGVTSTSAFGLNYIEFNALTATQGISALFKPATGSTGYAYDFEFRKDTTTYAGLLIIGGNASAGGGTANKNIFAISNEGGRSDWMAFRVAATNSSWFSQTDLLSLTHTQNVLIGTTTDAGYKLDVVGADSRFNGVRVGLGAGGVSTNTVVGTNALANNTTGLSNTAVGNGSLRYNIDGTYNTAYGVDSLNVNTTGGQNVAMGWRALAASTTAYSNVAIGTQALFANITGQNNTALGSNALYNNTASNNTAVGYQAGYTNTSGTSITAIGYQALRLSTGNDNTAVGRGSLTSNTTGAANTALGGFSLSQNTTGTNNVAVGVDSLRSNTASNNTAVGYQAAYSNTTAAGITAIGYQAGYSNTTALITAIGYFALKNNVDGGPNTAVGYGALASNVSSVANTAVGHSALGSSTDGSNTAVGHQSSTTNTTGSNNSSFGTNSLRFNTTGIQNTAIGSNALTNTTGSFNVGLGYLAGSSGVANTTGSNNIFIGYQATGVSATESNRTWIGNSSTTSTWLAGNVLIGTTTNAGYKLQVQGVGYFNTNTASTSSVLRLTDANTGTAWVGFSSVPTTGFFIGSNGGMTLGHVAADNSNPSTAHARISINQLGNPGLSLATNSANVGIVFSDGVNATIRMNFPSTGEAAITTISAHNLSIGVAASTGSLSSTTMKFFQSTGNVAIGTTTDAGYKLDVNGQFRATGETVLASASGNVGIGTVSPTSKLHINGADPFLRVNNVGSANTHGIKISYNSSDTQGFHLLYNPALAGAYLDNTYLVTSGQAYGDIYFRQNVSGTMTTRMTIKAETGNIGIGTTTPTDKVHIVDNTNGNKFARISAGAADASAAWVAQNDQVDNVVYRVFGSGVTGSQMGISLARSASLLANLGGSGKFLLGTFSNTDFVMGTGNAEKMRIVDSTGNILIATTTDLGNKLEVNGTINATAYKINNVLGYTGILNIPLNPPGQQNVDIQGGIIVNIF